MQLYQKEKTLSKAFAAYFKSRLNFKIFEKKDDPQRFFFLEVTLSENVVR